MMAFVSSCSQVKMGWMFPKEDRTISVVFENSITASVEKDSGKQMVNLWPLNTYET